MDEELLTFYERPLPRQPHMVVAFAGWPDAAEVATGALRYVIAKTRAPRLGSIASEPFYDFSSLRPLTNIEQGELKLLRFASNDLFFHHDDQTGHDFVFLLGIEPHLRWETYVRQVMRVVDELGVTRVITFGSMFDAVPHTKEAAVSGVASSEELRSFLRAHGVGLIDYQGPSSIHSLVQRGCQERGVESVSLWGHAPLYVRAPANPKVCWALLSRLALISPLSLDLSDLRAAGEYLTETLDKLLAENTTIRLYVRRLEEQYEGGVESAPLSDESTAQMIRDVEEFLRREQHRGE